jgi:hypothetical protein
MEKDRLTDTVMYIASLSLSSYKLAKGQTFDFQEKNTSEFLTSRYIPLINCKSLKTAHREFLNNMFAFNWKYGSEDFKNRTHPDLVSWELLPKEIKSKYAYDAALVKSAQDFYIALKKELEEELINSFLPISLEKKNGITAH